MTGWTVGHGSGPPWLCVRFLVFPTHPPPPSVDWEHPNTPEQARQYVKLLWACRDQLPAPRYLLTTALPVDPAVLGLLDVRALAAAVDHVNLMCYDFAGPWSAVAGHHAQLCASGREAVAVGWLRDAPAAGCPQAPIGRWPQLATSAQTGLRMLLQQGGMAPAQVLLGIPAYARVFPGARQPGDAFDTGAEDGDGGTALEIDYRDVPDEAKERVQIDYTCGAAHYVVSQAAGRPAFVSLDVPATVRIKAQFARFFGLGGLFYWTGAGDGTGADSLVAAGFDALHGGR